MNRKNAENKEAVYDELINPLMQQILRICYENGIAMTAQFHVPNPDDPEIMCSSQLPDADGKVPWQLQKAWLGKGDVNPAPDTGGNPGWMGTDAIDALYPDKPS